MKIAWVTRSFLDYRIPVFRELDRQCEGNLHLVFSGDYVPERVTNKAVSILGDRAIPLSGEWKIGSEDRNHLANRNFSLRLQPGLIRRIRSIQPDVLVCDGFFKWTFPSLFYRVFTGTPLVILYERTAHVERNAQKVRLWYRKGVLRFTDAMGCNGRLCREYTVSLGMDSRRITEGHMVADVEGLAAAAENLPEEQVQRLKATLNIKGRMILYVGRLHPLKGCMELLEGWSDFEKEHPDGATLVMVGDGEQGEALETFCREKELQNVRFAGAVDYDQIAPYYASSDAFIIPTLEDNWSLVVPEAMSCGLPILCSKYNGCWPELVQEGRNGWVFDPQEPARIYDTLKSMMHAEALGQMGEESKEIIKAHTPARSAESVYNACVQALAHRNRSPRKSPSDKGGRGD